MRLRHGRVTLELRGRKAGAGAPLLLLHSYLGSGEEWGDEVDAWCGPVHALDFSGHGLSEPVRGGAYYPELLAGDADVALERIGPAAVAGAGLGAYVALLLAGARPDDVLAALLLPGRGLEGGGAQPDFERPLGLRPAADDGKPAAGLSLLESDVRPEDYAAELAASARRLLLLESDDAPPAWWQAAGRSPRAEVVAGPLADALIRLAGACTPGQ